MAMPVYADPGSDATHSTGLWLTVTSATSDTAQQHTGTRSIKLDTGATPVTAAVTTHAGVLDDAGRRISFRYRISEIPAGTARIMVAVQSGAPDVFNLKLVAAGNLEIEAPGLSNVAGTAVLSVDTWHRIAVVYTITSATVFMIKVYVDGALDITVNSTGTLTNVTTSRLRIQLQSSAGTNKTAWVDDIFVDDGTDLEDPGDIRVTNKRPVANGGTNTFDGTTTTTDSGYGTGNAIYVNEQPLATTGRRFHAHNSSTADENFAIEGLSVGDIDLTGKAIVGRLSWAHCQGVSTDLLWDNGATAAPTVAIGAAGPRFAGTDTSSFPTSSSCVGLSRAVGHATNCILNECGMLIVYHEPIVKTPGAGSLGLSGLVPSLGLALGIAAGSLSLAGAAPSVVLAGGGLEVSPGAGALAITGYAPSLAEGIGIPAGAVTLTGTTAGLAWAIDLPAGSLALSGLTPTLGAGAVAAPDAGTLSLTGLAPSLAEGIGVPAGALTLSGASAALAFGIDLPAGSLVFTGSAPSLVGEGALAIDAGVLVLTGYAPSLVLAERISIPAGALIFTGTPSALAFGIDIGAGTVAVTGYAPSLVGAGAIALDPGALILTGYAPRLAFTLSPGVGALTLTGQAPVLAHTLPIGEGILSLTGLAPLSGRGVLIPAGALALTGQGVRLHTGLAIPAGALVVAGASPVLQTGLPIGAGSLVLTGFAPQIGQGIQIGAGALTLNGLTPSLATVILLPSGQLAFVGLAPNALVGVSLMEPAAGVLTLTGYAPILAYAIQMPSGALTLAGYVPVSSLPFPAVADVIILVGPEV